MWRRKLTASIVKCSSSPCSSQAAARTVRSKSVCCVSVGVNAREVVRPRQQRCGGVEGVAVERLRPPQRPPRLERGAHAAPEEPVAVGPRPRGKTGAEAVLGLLREHDGDVVRQCRVERARRTFGGGPPSPGSSRPVRSRARRCRSGRRRRARPSQGRPRRAPRETPSTVRSPGCRAQPRNPVPSYSSVSFRVFATGSHL